MWGRRRWTAWRRKARLYSACIISHLATVPTNWDPSAALVSTDGFIFSASRMCLLGVVSSAKRDDSWFASSLRYILSIAGASPVAFVS